MKILETDRLLLRTWRDDDLEPFFAINQDPQVMEFFPSLQDLETTQRLITRSKEHLKAHSYSLYACERKDIRAFIGFIGLMTPHFDAHFTPAIEIGWRLASSAWGKGFATEGARAILEDGFQRLELSEIVSFTAKQNQKSIRVMEKIGLKHDAKDDFDHPKLEEGHPLRRHVLYRLSKERYFKRGER